MTKVLRISLQIILLFLFSCSTENSQENNKSVTETEKAEDQKPEIKENFPIHNFPCHFEYDSTYEGALFKVDLTILNNTDKKINNLEIVSGIKIQFKGETSITYFPDVFSQYSSDVKYLNNPLTAQLGAINNYKKKNHWLPGEDKTFHLEVFDRYTPNWRKYGFHHSVFERTPSSAVFIYYFKFIGVEGEYSDIISIDILDSWREYQEKIGLR